VDGGELEIGWLLTRDVIMADGGPPELLRRVQFMRLRALPLRWGEAWAKASCIVFSAVRCRNVGRGAGRATLRATFSAIANTAQIVVLELRDLTSCHMLPYSAGVRGGWIAVSLCNALAVRYAVRDPQPGVGCGQWDYARVMRWASGCRSRPGVGRLSGCTAACRAASCTGVQCVLPQGCVGVYWYCVVVRTDT
jgi:hypothetical protein